MTSFSDDIGAMAADVLRVFGGPATLRGRPSLALDGTETAGQESAVTASPPSTRRGYVRSDGLVVGAVTNSWCLPTAVPQVGGTLTFGAESWKIVGVMAANPGEPAAYKMELER